MNKILTHYRRITPNWSWRLEWKPADLWVGVFVKDTQYAVGKDRDIWLCIIPMLPIHLCSYIHDYKAETEL